jgi:inosose dehydratase
MAREGWDYFEAVRRGVFCELGQGGVDFSAFIAAIRERDGWLIVEQDVLPGMGTPLESARRNREFLAGLGL